MLIAIDAGHCKYTPGKRCLKSIDPKETREWYLNQRIATKVVNLLKNYDCSTIRTDDPTGETDVSLSNRCKRANDAKADYFISIHHDSGINGGSGGGITIFSYLGPSAKSQKLRKAVYDGVIATTGLKGNRATPLNEANYQVLRDTRMTAILGEFGFMDSTTDTPIILTEDFATKCAQGIVNGLVSATGIKKIKEDAPEQTEKDDKEMRYKTINDVPEGEFRNTIKGLMDKGIILGKGNGVIDLSEDMVRMYVTLNRAGVFK